MSKTTKRHITIAVRGYNGGVPAESVEDATAAAFLMWVELPSGARIEAGELTGARFRFIPDDIVEATLEFSNPDWLIDGEIDLIGAPFIVLVDGDGQPLPTGEGTA